MIERNFVATKKKEFEVQEFISENLKGVGLSHTKIQRTPLGEKIIIYATRPGLIIGGGGTNIKKLTKQLKKRFNLENPQIEISEVENPNLVANVVAERIASTMEKFGAARFKGIGHKAMVDVLSAGGKGIEILISGKIPSARARTWRFYQGYIKKCGQAALELVDTAYAIANLKSGIVGIKVSIMPPNVRLPDEIRQIKATIEEVKTEESKSVQSDIEENIATQEKAQETDKKEEKAQKKPKAKK